MRLWTYYRKELLKDLWIKTAYDDVVLDVWCFDWYWLSTQKAKEKHAIDLDIEPKYKDINYKNWDATKLPYKDLFFDKVFAFDVIEHIKEWKEKEFIKELIRVTKKDWNIILTTPSKSIRLFPSFLTNYISKKWWHYKCNWYTKNEIQYFVWNKVYISILNLNCRWYLNNYLFLRFLWKINKKLVRNILQKIAKNDSQEIWNNGYLLIKIEKYA